jgi:type IV secretory pathway VirB4 component
MPIGAQKASQEFVPVSEVRDGVVILKNGEMRVILMTSSLNFALKSEDEQTAFIVQFQNFLNSLDFSVQIFIQSRMLDIRPYISSLEEAQKNQLDDLMRTQIHEYVEFVKNFTEAANIMSKSFFVVVPYTPAIINMRKGMLSQLPWKKRKVSSQEVNRSFEENLSQLEQRVAVVQQGLVRCGVRTVQLGTEETIELLYKLFNPGERSKPIAILESETTQKT